MSASKEIIGGLFVDPAKNAAAAGMDIMKTMTLGTINNITAKVWSSMWSLFAGSAKTAGKAILSLPVIPSVK